MKNGEDFAPRCVSLSQRNRGRQASLRLMINNINREETGLFAPHTRVYTSGCDGREACTQGVSVGRHIHRVYLRVYHGSTVHRVYLRVYHRVYTGLYHPGRLPYLPTWYIHHPVPPCIPYHPGYTCTSHAGRCYVCCSAGVSGVQQRSPGLNPGNNNEKRGSREPQTLRCVTVSRRCCAELFALLRENGCKDWIATG